jgi:hypothetical protein
VTAINGSGIHCHYNKDQVGNDAASRPTRRQIKLAMKPQVVLQDDDLSRQDAANEIKFGLILLQEAA